MNILTIGAHPDDTEYGCGGTLLKMKEAGHKVFMMIMTRGEVGGDPEIRSKEQRSVAEFIGVDEIFWGDQADTKIPVDKEIISLIDRAIKKSAADVVMFNYIDDTHQDHRSLARCAISATRHVKQVLMFEVPTTQHFEPDIFVDIGDIIEKKERLLLLHASQVEKTGIPHLEIYEGMRACAGFRGYQGRVKYAEGFKAVRYLMDWRIPC